jgi:FtsP/CotA-like multicopper oxidase with cupredoxin domain
MTQMALGLMGMFIIHPRNPTGPKADRDFALMLSEWRIDVGTMRPNPIEMTDFNVFTLNARAFPAPPRWWPNMASGSESVSGT